MQKLQNKTLGTNILHNVIIFLSVHICVLGYVCTYLCMWEGNFSHGAPFLTLTFLSYRLEFSSAISIHLIFAQLVPYAQYSVVMKCFLLSLLMYVCMYMSVKFPIHTDLYVFRRVFRFVITHLLISNFFINIKSIITFTSSALRLIQMSTIQFLQEYFLTSGMTFLLFRTLCPQFVANNCYVIPHQNYS